MDPILVLLATIVGATALLIVVGLASETISAFVRHYVPHFDYDGDTALLTGLLLLTALALGIMGLYLLTKL
ncbi:MAG: hypothetical protein ACM3JD_17515 [Rudaea sp.]